jgi:hypothetical protein
MFVASPPLDIFISASPKAAYEITGQGFVMSAPDER